MKSEDAITQSATQPATYRTQQKTHSLHQHLTVMWFHQRWRLTPRCNNNPFQRKCQSLPFSWAVLTYACVPCRTSYYPYSGYTQSAYYSYAQPPPHLTSTQTTITSARTNTQTSTSANQNESNDVENLKDALGQAGVDLRVEQHRLPIFTFRRS